MNKVISKERVLALALMLAVLLILYFVFLYNVSIIEGERYYAASSEITTKPETVTAARGDILDRYGRVLISNKECYNLTIDTGRCCRSRWSRRLTMTRT